MHRLLILLFCIFITPILLLSCRSDHNPVPSNAKALTAYFFASLGSKSVIDESAKTISIFVPYGTDITGLIAEYITTGVKVQVGPTIQESGITANDFSKAVLYTITAADSSAAEYTVTVSIKASVVDLPETGQKTSYANGDDGDLQEGVTSPNPRFTANDNGMGVVVLDNLSSLMWPQNAGAPTVGLCSGGTTTWQGAIDYVSCLNTNNYLGYSDWRLPNANEIGILVSTALSGPDTVTWLTEQGFVNVANDWSICYWSSTTYFGNAAYAWAGCLGDVAYMAKDNSYIMRPIAWPVRGGQRGALADPYRTGQTISYSSGDDGSLQEGAEWPNPRFTNVDGSTPINESIVLDKLTGLIWSKDANTPGPATCNPGAAKTWQAALDHISCLNLNTYLGYSDWRLPNENELKSIVDFGQNSSSWLNGIGFTTANVDAYDDYWSSTSSPVSGVDNNAVVISLFDGFPWYADKTARSFPVWPVRSGL